MRLRLGWIVLIMAATFACAVPALADLVGYTDADEISGVEYMLMTGLPPYDLGEAASDTVMPISQSAVILDEVPTSNWHYGCSATSAGMMFAYYDRIGYVNLFDQPVPDSLDTDTSIIATDDHVNDYWVSSGSSGPDPWESGGTEHTWQGCAADFMGTNQWKWDYSGDGDKDSNADGSTTLFWYNGANKLYDYIPGASAGTPQTALSHGLRWFAESRGYTVVENYTQRIHELYEGGFSFGDYVSEIDAGNPVMIQVTNHSMVGVGYNLADSTVYLHDTWGNSIASMTWADSYSGLDHQAVTVIHLDPSERVPEPATLIMLLLGVSMLSAYIRQKRAG